MALYNYSIHECPERTSQYLTGCLVGHSITVPIPVNGVSYSTVCGRILGYGWGGRAFDPFIDSHSSIESDYINSVSLTHGPPGNRRHIWSFVNAHSC